MSEADKSKAGKYLEVVKTEIEKEEPNQQLIAKSLKQTAENLKIASKNHEGGKILWDQVRLILVRVTGWARQQGYC